MKNERKAALFAIMDVMEKKSYIKEAIDNVLPKGGGDDGFDAMRSAYIRKAVRGVVERAIELDARVGHYSKIKIKKMHPIVRNVLRLGCYEICYMDSIPASASVNESVKLLKKNGQYRSAGLCNALLRMVADNPDSNEWYKGLPHKKQLSVRYSMPEWLVSRFTEWYGNDEAEDIFEGFLLERGLSLRLNLSVTGAEDWEQRVKTEGIYCRPLEGACYELSGYRDIKSIPGFDKGEFYIQDPSSAAVCVAADIKEGMKVLDVCASPGGKSLHAADLVGKNGSVESRDISPQKVKRIQENIAASPFSTITTKVFDASVYDKSCEEAFDVVLIDAPCSGLGVIQKKPEIKYRLNEKDLEELSGIQASILEACHTYPRPGGRLVYSTCTVNPSENAGRCEAFLKKHGEYRSVYEKQILPDGDRDGFFICVMEKQA